MIVAGISSSGALAPATAPLRGATLFHDVLGALAAEPVLAFLAGAILTWLCHSTLAAILLPSSFTMNGSLTTEQALPFVLGLLSRALPVLHLTPATAVAQMHLILNLAASVLLPPLAAQIGRLVGELLPAAGTGHDADIAPRYLNRAALDSPQMALTNAALETARITEIA